MSDAHWKIGANYLIRTATMIDAGKLVAVTEHELVLEDASWIADTGRFGKALETSSFNEVEMFPHRPGHRRPRFPDRRRPDCQSANEDEVGA